MMKKLLILLLLPLLAHAQWGIEYIQESDSTTYVYNGESIAQAVANTVSGGKIIVDAGVYTDSSLTIAKNLTIELSEGATWTACDTLFSVTDGYVLSVVGEGTITQKNGTRKKLWIGDDVSLEGLTINFYFIYVDTSLAGDYMTWENCDFVHTPATSGDSLVVMRNTNIRNCSFTDSPLSLKGADNYNDTASVNLDYCNFYNSGGSNLHLPFAYGKGVVVMNGCESERASSSAGYSIGGSAYANLTAINCTARNYGSGAGNATWYWHNIDFTNAQYTPKVKLINCAGYNAKDGGYAFTAQTGDSVRIQGFSHGENNLVYIDSTEINTARFTFDQTFAAGDKCIYQLNGEPNDTILFTSNNDQTVGAIKTHLAAEGEVDVATAVYWNGQTYKNRINIIAEEDSVVVFDTVYCVGSATPPAVTLEQVDNPMPYMEYSGEDGEKYRPRTTYEKWVGVKIPTGTTKFSTDTTILIQCTGGDSIVFDGNGYAEINNCDLVGTVVGASSPKIVFQNSTITVGDRYAFYTETGEVRSRESCFFNNSDTAAAANDFAAFKVAGGDVEVSLVGGSFVNDFCNAGACVEIASGDTIEIIQIYGNGICLIDSLADGSKPVIEWGGAKFRRTEILGGATNPYINQYMQWANEDNYLIGGEILAQQTDNLGFTSCVGGNHVWAHAANQNGGHTMFLRTDGSVDLQGGLQSFTIGDSAAGDARTAITNLYWVKEAFVGNANTDVVTVTGIVAGAILLPIPNDLYDADDGLTAKITGVNTVTVYRENGAGGTSNLPYALLVIW